MWYLKSIWYPKGAGDLENSGRGGRCDFILPEGAAMIDGTWYFVDSTGGPT